MKISLIPIDDAKGLLLPDFVLEKYHIQDKVELILENDHLIIKPVPTPRSGWAEAFRQMHEAGDDHLLIDDVLSDEHFDDK